MVIEDRGKRVLLFNRFFKESVPIEILEDSNVIIFEFNNKILLFSKRNSSLELACNLYDDFSFIEKTYNGYIIVTDSTIVLVSKFNFTILKVKVFSDTIKGIKQIDRKIIIETFFDGIFEEMI